MRTIASATVSPLLTTTLKTLGMFNRIAAAGLIIDDLKQASGFFRSVVVGEGGGTATDSDPDSNVPTEPEDASVE